MKKPVKKTPTKQASSASNIASIKKEFKAKLTDLSKKFDKQLAEVKKAAKAKAAKDVHDSFTKHTNAKNKAVKDAITQVDKARAEKRKSPMKKTEKIVKAIKLNKVISKKLPAGRKKSK